jgi:cytochrome c oxidase cbb3-type subunit III
VTKVLALCAALILVAFARSFGGAAAADLTAGKQTYDAYCANCHGVIGNGEGPSAKWLSPGPRDFTACKLMRRYSDADLFKAIKDGGPAAYVSYNMAPWGAVLSDEQIGNVLAYERSFCPTE